MSLYYIKQKYGAEIRVGTVNEHQVIRNANHYMNTPAWSIRDFCLGEWADYGYVCGDGTNARVRVGSKVVDLPYSTPATSIQNAPAGPFTIAPSGRIKLLPNYSDTGQRAAPIKPLGEHLSSDNLYVLIKGAWVSATARFLD